MGSNPDKIKILQVLMKIFNIRSNERGKNKFLNFFSATQIFFATYLTFRDLKKFAMKIFGSLNPKFFSQKVAEERKKTGKPEAAVLRPKLRLRVEEMGS